MGCAVAKDNVADGEGGNDQGDRANDRDRHHDGDNVNPLDAAANRGGRRQNGRRGNRNNRNDDEDDNNNGDDNAAPNFPRPQMEGYWIAGTQRNTNSAPTFIPVKGPWSTTEKVPTPPAPMHNTILFKKQHEPEIPIGHEVAAKLQLGNDQPAASDEASAGAAVAEAKGDAKESSVVKGEANSDNLVGTPVQPRRESQPLADRRGSNSLVGLDAQNLQGTPLAQPIRQHEGEEKENNFSAVTPPIAKPPLAPIPAQNTVGNTTAKKRGSAFARRQQQAFMPMPIPRMFHSAVQIDNAVAANKNPPQPAAYTSVFTLPKHHFVGRAVFPHPLANFTVGWVKLPAGPVSSRTTLNGIGQSGSTTDGSGAEMIGYLSPSKPLYDVAIDGPVNDPYTTLRDDEDDKGRDAINQDDGDDEDHEEGEEAAANREAMERARIALHRHVQKYFLYVDTVQDLGISMKFHQVDDNGDCVSAAVDARHVGSSTSPAQHYCSIFSDAAGGDHFFSGADDDLLATSTTTSRPPIDDMFFTFSLPPSSQASLSFAYAENSMPVYLLSNLHLQFPQWWTKFSTWFLKNGGESGEESAAKNGDESEEKKAQGTELDEDTMNHVATLARTLTGEQKLWLVFRYHFNTALVGYINNHVKEAKHVHAKGPTRIKINFGMKFRYDNQRFVAFNSNSRLQSSTQVFNDQKLPEHLEAARPKHHSFMRFVDESRQESAVSQELLDQSENGAGSSVTLEFREDLHNGGAGTDVGSDLDKCVSKLSDEANVLKEALSRYLSYNV